jgi:uncharacterized protein (DUF2235 family)
MKRIIVCADGTWNIRDQKSKGTTRRRPTNVTKIARAIRPRDRHGVDQIVFYYDGLGTGGPLDRMTGGAFGRGIEANIRAIYRFIVYNYEPNDELYFFGFSRGAFTVRSLAGFMHVVGLIGKDDDYYVPEIYACYESNEGPSTDAWRKAFHKVRDVRPCPPIRFIGVWDTVGSLGAPGLLGHLFNSKKYQYHDVGLSSAIQNAYHALAIDERRKPFAPSLWSKPSGWGGQLQQAWFAGAHTNVGGSFTPDGLANEALHWIVEKAEALGLEVDGPYLDHFKACFDAEEYNSMTAKYRLLGVFERQLGTHRADGEAVHQSAVDRLNWPRSAYQPRNLKAYLNSSPPVADTRRVARGTPCSRVAESDLERSVV